MSINYRFDPEKAVEVLLYVSTRVPDMYKALKILYLADKLHLAQYGRLICGDRYVAMRLGPVPSGAYDLVKYARGDGFCWPDTPVEQAFAVQGNTIVPHRAANTDLLSESEIACLDEAISKYGHRSFGSLKRLSHDSAYEAADENDFMSLEAIAKTLPEGDLLLDYLQNC